MALAPTFAAAIAMEPRPPAPPQTRTTSFSRIVCGAHPKSIGSGGAYKRGGRGCFPAQVLRFGMHGAPAPSCNWANAPRWPRSPDSVTKAYIGSSPARNLRGVDIPLPQWTPLRLPLDVRDVRTDAPDDPGGIGAADVVVERVSALLAGADDIDRRAEAGPDVVVVHARGHHVDEHVIGADLRGIHDFHLESLVGLAETGLADDLGVHARRHMAEWRRFADGVQVFEGIGGQAGLLGRVCVPSRRAAGAQFFAYYPTVIDAGKLYALSHSSLLCFCNPLSRRPRRHFDSKRPQPGARAAPSGIRERRAPLFPNHARTTQSSSIPWRPFLPLPRDASNRAVAREDLLALISFSSPVRPW